MMFRKQRTAHARAAINAPAIVDREFLSPALAILDTPASPIGSSTCYRQKDRRVEARTLGPKVNNGFIGLACPSLEDSL